MSLTGEDQAKVDSWPLNFFFAHLFCGAMNDDGGLFLTIFFNSGTNKKANFLISCNNYLASLTYCLCIAFLQLISSKFPSIAFILVGNNNFLKGKESF